MPELPRLDNLIGLTYSTGNNRDRVFYRYVLYGGIQQQADKIKGLLLLDSLVFEPASAADSKVSARWVGNHQVPVLV